MVVETASARLSTCEVKLIAWIREHAVPFGTLTGKLQVDFQDGHAVMIRIAESLKEEKFR